MQPLPSFEQELEDVEVFLAKHAPSDSQLQSLDEATEVEVQIDPADGEGRHHQIHPLPEPRLTRETLVQRADAHPMVLGLMLFDRFEGSWLEWDPEVLVDEVTSLFGEPHPVNLGKWAAIQMVYRKSAPWDEWHYFLLFLQPVNDFMIDPDTYRPPTVEEVGVAVGILRLVDDKQEYSDEVKVFIEQVLRWNQWAFPPENLKGVVPPSEDLFPVDTARFDSMRKHPQLIDDSVEGFFAARVVEYDLHMAQMRKRLQQQLAVVRRPG